MISELKKPFSSYFFPRWTEKMLYKNWETEREGFEFATEKNISKNLKRRNWMKAFKKHFSTPKGKE